MGGKTFSLTSILQKARTLVLAKEKVLEAYVCNLGISDKIIEGSSLASPLSSFVCVSDDVSTDEEAGHSDEIFAMQTLDRNKDLLQVLLFLRLVQ